MMDLLPWLAKSTLLLALASAATLALRNASADLRHLVWRAVFAALLLLPLMARMGPSWTPAAVELAPARTVITVFADDAEPAPRWPPLEWAWGSVAAMLLLREAARHVRAHLAVRRSAEYAGAAGVRLSRDVAVPAVFGIIRPVILLPAEARAWSEDRLRVVLAHERMHILRGDPAWIAAARVIAALWWPNPLVCYALVRLVREAEQACDDGVLAGGTPAGDYATHLVAIVRSISTGEVRYQGGLPMIRVSELERRLRAMLNPKVNRRPAARGALLILLLASAFVLAPLSSLRAPAQSQQAASPGGTVEDADGKPVAHAEVTAQAPPDTGAKPEAPKRIAVGGTVQRARLIKQVPPVYPAACKAAGIEGTVVLSIVIGKDGAVQSARRLNRQVDERLADAAVEAVKQWVYQPTLLNGEPVEVMTDVEVNFTLAEKSAAAPAAQIGLFRVGDGVSAPRPVYKVEPEYSEQARAAGYQGTVLLETEIDEAGTPLNIKVLRSLGMGLDEKAVEALSKWKFAPGQKDGKPVRVNARVEMVFRLSAK